jgi:hypothetical protein
MSGLLNDELRLQSHFIPVSPYFLLSPLHILRPSVTIVFQPLAMAFWIWQRFMC